MTDFDIWDCRSVYMPGIGGIGMSALAQWLQARGCTVAGYDQTQTPLTRRLAAKGIAVSYQVPESIDQLADYQGFIYTPAIKPDNPIWQLAVATGKQMIKRSVALGQLAARYTTLAVGGTHGKTTTTGLLSWLLFHAGLAPTALIGGICNNFNSNYVGGAVGKWLVLEADEFDRSFLTLSPGIAVITSTDADHLDIYGDSEAVRKGYLAFAQTVKPDGSIFIADNETDLITALTNLGYSPTIITYGFSPAATFQAFNLRASGTSMYFDLKLPDNVILENLHLPLPGAHNVSNAVAALAIALTIGVNADTLRAGLSEFKGVWRRFDIRYSNDNILYVDDYAHHPTEITAAITAARALRPGWRLVVAFQPHLFTRTRDFAAGFADALSLADHILLLPIYPAREKPIAGVSSEMIAALMKNKTSEICLLQRLPDRIESILKAATAPLVLLTLGAGDIDTQVAAIEKIVTNYPRA